MARFSGKIGLNRGYSEVSPGVHRAEIEEIDVRGIMRNLSIRTPNAGVREGVTARHVLSIVTPERSVIDFTEAEYVIWQSQKWAVTALEYKRPRVDLTLGGLYNG